MINENDFDIAQLCDEEANIDDVIQFLTWYMNEGMEATKDALNAYVEKNKYEVENNVFTAVRMFKTACNLTEVLIDKLEMDLSDLPEEDNKIRPIK